MRVQITARWSPRSPNRPGRRGAGLRPADAASAPTSTSARRSTLSALAGGRRCGRAAAAARVADHRQQALGLPPVRPHGAHQHARAAAGMGAGVVRIKGTARALAMSTDGNGRYCYLDPRRGAMLAVAEAARNVACAGARADRRHQLPQLRQPRAAGDHVAVRRGGRRHRRGLPRARYPDHRRQRQPLQRDRRQRDLSDAGHRRRRPASKTPIARASPRASRRRATRSSCSATARGELGGSEYLKVVHGLVRGDAAGADLDRERALITLLSRRGGRGLLSRRTTALTAVSPSPWRSAASTPAASGAVRCAAAIGERRVSDLAGATLFGESASRVVVSATAERDAALEQLAARAQACRREHRHDGGSRLRSPSPADRDRLRSRSGTDVVGALGRYFARQSSDGTCRGSASMHSFHGAGARRKCSTSSKTSAASSGSSDIPRPRISPTSVSTRCNIAVRRARASLRRR